MATRTDDLHEHVWGQVRVSDGPNRIGVTYLACAICGAPKPVDPDLLIDPDRAAHDNTTGIYVRARDDLLRWYSIDIACLTKESLLTWLRSRPDGAEQTVLILLGYPR